MVRVPVTKEVNAAKLAEELSTRWPSAWISLEVVDGQLYLTDISDATTAAELQAVLDAHNAATKTNKTLARERVVQLAQSTVGVSIRDLTAAQVKALLAVFLYTAGAIDANGIVQPFDKWVH